MAIHQGPYEPATDCTQEMPGARALMDWYLAKYSAAGGTDLGIYNCRNVRGGTSRSIHSEGRACDLGNPVGAAWQQDLADELMNNSAELEIQLLLYNRQVWSVRQPNAGWRGFDGSPHLDHIHAELTRAGGEQLTEAQIIAVLGDPSVGQPPPAPPGGGGGGGGRMLKLTSPMMKGPDVTAVQNRLLELGYSLPQHGADGWYGEESAAAVRQLQANAGIGVDGIVGPRTRQALEQGVRA